MVALTARVVTLDSTVLVRSAMMQRETKRPPEADLKVGSRRPPSKQKFKLFVVCANSAGLTQHFCSTGMLKRGATWLQFYCHGGNLNYHLGKLNVHGGTSSLHTQLQATIHKGGGDLLCGYAYGWLKMVCKYEIQIVVISGN